MFNYFDNYVFNIFQGIRNMGNCIMCQKRAKNSQKRQSEFALGIFPANMKILICGPKGSGKTTSFGNKIRSDFWLNILTLRVKILRGT